MKLIIRKKTLIIMLLIIVLAAIGLILFIFPTFTSPQKKTVDEFFHAVMEQDKYNEYLHTHLKNHPFLDLLDSKQVSQFQIERIEALGQGKSRFWISARFPAGRVPFCLDVEKYDNQWKISKLPEAAFHTQGIPISKSETEKNLNNWNILVGEYSLDVPASQELEIKIGRPVSFTTLDGIIVSLEYLKPIKLTKVLSLSDTILEDKELGLFEIMGDFPVYLEDNENFEFRGYHSIPIGFREAVLYQTDDQIGRMAILTHPVKNYDNIRVLLQNSNYTSFLHTSLEVTCQDEFEIYSAPNRINITFDRNQAAEFRPSEQGVEVWKDGELLSVSPFRWHISSKNEAPLYVKTIQRNQSEAITGTPYRGTMEVAMTDGMLTLVNELGLEEYLYSVVPSEMPVRFGLEALKVQAVAARAYAARAIQSSGYRAYGAHLDDSTASQVYNNISEQDVATHAVNETAGMVPIYGNQIVDTRFFSTSCGYTANFHEVWSNEQHEFPREEVPYLTANPQYPGNIPDLFKEENFRAFLDQTDLPGYDQFSPFFRWSVKMTRQQMEAILSNTLPAVYQQQPLFVLTKTADGSYKSIEIPDDIGTLLNMEVLRRGGGGNIMELEISTTHGIFKIIKEYNVRRILAPVNYLNSQPLVLYCHDGSTRENFPLLPSAFAYVDFGRDIEGNVEEISVHGGGYGHGVGMSQYGAYGLTLLGKTWQDIIFHYYPGSELMNLYER